MPLYPTILKDPQLKLPKKERAAILKQAANRWFAKPSNMVLYVFIVVFWVLLMFIATPIAAWFSVDKFLSTAIIWGALYPAMFILTYWLIFNFNFLPHLYHELRARHHDICPKCGYILLTLPESTTTCPECGTHRDPLPETQPKSES